MRISVTIGLWKFRSDFVIDVAVGKSASFLSAIEMKAFPAFHRHASYAIVRLDISLNRASNSDMSHESLPSSSSGQSRNISYNTCA